MLNSNVCEAQLIDSSLDNVVDLQGLWEDELDVMGAAATDAELQVHLAKAPCPEAASTVYLLNYLMGLKAEQARVPAQSS